MTPLPCFFAPETAAHEPEFWMARGVVGQNKERSQRATLLLDALDRLRLAVTVPDSAGLAPLRAVHEARYLDFLATAWAGWQQIEGHGPEIVANAHPQKSVARYPQGLIGRVGWHMADTSCPLGPHSWAAIQRAADCAVAAAQAVIAGAPGAYALCRPPGHHANADTAGGHCFVNNAAIAAQALRGAHDRVAVLDIDVHHGNGTQEIFYYRGDVLTVSIHTDPTDFYPFFLGHADERGTGAGAGCNLNLPLERGAGDDAWLAAIDAGLARIRDFNPGAMVLSLGLDAHERDPFQGMRVTTPGFRRAGARIAAAGIPCVIVQEGGYLSDDLTDNLAAFLTGWIG